MSPKNKQASQTSTALYHRIRSHDNKISKPEKHVHESLANAERGKGKERMTSVFLSTLLNLANS